MDGAELAPTQARIQVSNKQKTIAFYVNLAKRFLQQYGEVQLSALGLAISTVVTVAEILKGSGLAVEKRIRTGLNTVDDDGNPRAVSKPSMEVVLVKTPEFDSIIAEQLAEHQQDAGNLEERDGEVEQTVEN